LRSGSIKKTVRGERARSTFDRLKLEKNKGVRVPREGRFRKGFLGDKLKERWGIQKKEGGEEMKVAQNRTQRKEKTEEKVLQRDRAGGEADMIG